MPNYRRLYVPGGTYFFTVVTDRRRRLFNQTQYVSVLLDSIEHVRKHRRFEVVASVILPDHLHCIWTLPPHDSDFSTRWRLIKTRFTSRATNPQNPPPYWQRRFWEHLIRDPEDLERHFRYIHFNPVKHRLVESAEDWPYSTFHRYQEMGWYDREHPLSEPEGFEVPE